ncbi:MAG: hypothetical protein WKG07_00070 [Hymenobacter sp.]
MILLDTYITQAEAAGKTAKTEVGDDGVLPRQRPARQAGARANPGDGAHG